MCNFSYVEMATLNKIYFNKSVSVGLFWVKCDELLDLLSFLVSIWQPWCPAAAAAAAAAGSISSPAKSRFIIVCSEEKEEWRISHATVVVEENVIHHSQHCSGTDGQMGGHWGEKVKSSLLKIHFASNFLQ